MVEHQNTRLETPVPFLVNTGARFSLLQGLSSENSGPTLETTY